MFRRCPAHSLTTTPSYILPTAGSGSNEGGFKASGSASYTDGRRADCLRRSSRYVSPKMLILSNSTMNTFVFDVSVFCKLTADDQPVDSLYHFRTYSAPQRQAHSQAVGTAGDLVPMVIRSEIYPQSTANSKRWLGWYWRSLSSVGQMLAKEQKSP